MPGAVREIVLAVMLVAVITPPFNALLTHTARYSEADITRLRQEALTIVEAKSDRQAFLAQKTSMLQ
jgi:hypothetical protein